MKSAKSVRIKVLRIFQALGDVGGILYCGCY